jgi:hypothetical protein
LKQFINEMRGGRDEFKLWIVFVEKHV